MSKTTIEIQQNQAIYKFLSRDGETPDEAVIRELGWALKLYIEKYNTLQQALDRLGWSMSTTTHCEDD